MNLNVKFSANLGGQAGVSQRSEGAMAHPDPP